LTERTSKKKQFDLAKKILNSEIGLDAGIFTFFDEAGNFRFSLVYKVYKGTKKEFSHYKRHTYFVEKGKPYRTFLKNIASANFTTLKDLIEAFSTYPLTREFYTEIQNWYAWALKHAWFPGGKLEENLIRLITRLIFVWFLKERKLIPEEIFEPEFLTKVIKDFGKADHYYNVILQNLFFATLNRYPQNRKFAKSGSFLENRTEFGVKNLFRYQDRLLISEEEFIKIFEKVPFINGGLFECLDNDSYYIDGFSRNEKKRAKLPDFLFFSNERKEDLSDFYGTKKVETVRGLINILKDYNFTADENSPIDVEVSLDPELLGHIFENLLACYNPETATTARKATGSYYTPKEIVDFMVEESLVECLKTKTGIDEEKLRWLFSYEEETDSEKPKEESKLYEEEKEKLVNTIDTLKILDPAVGSGAFPMGVLHKLVHVLSKIDSENKLWYELQYKKALHEVEEVLRNKDKLVQEQRLKEINENFDESINYPDYARKLYLIENSIYGVDIQPIAIQICKLRFFLSLLIDQKIDPEKENYGIKPLPHLETKFVSANTLIGLEKPKGNGLKQSNLIEAGEIAELKEKLKELYKQHFRIKTRTEKKRLQEKAQAIRQRIKELLIKNQWGEETAKKIAEFDIFDQTATADWFDPEWMFGVEDGFDIVIGNPPYISTKGIDKKLKTALERHYGFADDSYNHFYFRGMELLKEKGILTYISSKTFWTIQTKRNLRELLLNNKIVSIFDTANPFKSSMVDTCVITVQKEKAGQEHIITFLDGKKDLKNPEKYEVNQKVFQGAPNSVFFIPTSYNMQIYKKFGKKVRELLDKWWDKICTSKNIEKYKKELEEYRKSLKPGDVTLLGLITEGGQGLATGNNGKYIGVLDGTKWAKKVREERPEKLWNFIQRNNPQELSHLKSKQEVKAFLDSLSEKEIRKLFDNLKEKYGRDIFGQGWLYRIVSKDEIADVDNLSEDEKLNGIEGKRTFVPYDKGDKEGNRWYAPTPYYIDWSRENVKYLQKDPKARWQGYQFYFREGFCWNFALLPQKEESMYIKCRIKEKTVHDVMTMALHSLGIVSNKFIVSIINSKFYYHILKTFINSTAGQQINDFRQLPVIIPTLEQLKEFEAIFDRAYNIQKRKFAGEITEKEAEKQLEEIQKELDEKVEKMYMG
ncbi:MAG: hypothetical protein DRP29_06230, partial [Thermodesulfobacteriota bacterium]